MNDFLISKKIQKIYSLMTCIGYISLIFLAFQVFLISKEGGDYYGVYVSDPISIGLALTHTISIYIKWILIGARPVEFDSTSPFKSANECARLIDYMYKGQRFVIKMKPSYEDFERAAQLYFSNGNNIRRNFDLYKIIFLVKRYLMQIIFMLVVFVFAVFLGPNFFDKPSLRALTPLTPLLVLLCWITLGYIFSWVILYFSINKLRSK